MISVRLNRGRDIYGCSFLWVVPGDEFESEDPVEYVHEAQGFDTTEFGMQIKPKTVLSCS